MAGSKTSRVWEEVRRALGRLASRTTVHELASEWSAPAIVKRSDAAVTLTATAGLREDVWRPQADTVLWPIPSVKEGDSGTDLASVAAVISADESLTYGAAPVCCPSWRLEVKEAREWDLSEAVLVRPGVSAPPIRFGGLTVQAARMALKVEDVRRISVPRVALAKPRPAKAASAWALPPPRMRSDLGIMARVPIIRESVALPPGLGIAEAFAAERRQLAASARLEEADVLLLGVYPQVPLAMVNKLSLVGGSRETLQIWLKPAALAAGPKGVKLATIILGRQRSTGRTLQAVSRTPAPNFGNR